MTNSASQAMNRARWMLSISIILAVYQIAFAYRVLLNNSVSPDVLTLSPAIQAAFAISWGMLFAVGVWRLWHQQPQSVRYTAWLLIGFCVFRLLEQAVFVVADYNHNRLSFLIVITLMILTVPVALLWRQRGTQK